MDTEYPNPVWQLQQRPFYGEETLEYSMMVEKVHKEFSNALLINYCGVCHSIETKDTILAHNNHLTYTKTAIIGSTTKETWAKFIAKASFHKHIDSEGKIRAVLFTKYMKHGEKMQRNKMLANQSTNDEKPLQNSFLARDGPSSGLLKTNPRHQSFLNEIEKNEILSQTRNENSRLSFPNSQNASLMQMPRSNMQEPPRLASNREPHSNGLSLPSLQLSDDFQSNVLREIVILKQKQSQIINTLDGIALDIREVLGLLKGTKKGACSKSQTRKTGKGKNGPTTSSNKVEGVTTRRRSGIKAPINKSKATKSAKNQKSEEEEDNNLDGDEEDQQEDYEEQDFL